MSVHPLSYGEATRILQRYQVPLARGRLASDPQHAAAAAAAIGYPVALKLLTPAASHKSDAGLVRLNLADERALRQAAEELEALGQRLPGGLAEAEGILVQEMAPGGVEMIVGSSLDPQFGPVLMLGAGGVLVELLEDAALRLPPLTSRDAQAMIDELRVARLLRGYRGRPAADLAALSRLLLSVSQLVVEQSAWLDSLDLNPVMVLPAGQGVRVVDFRLFARQP